MPYPSKLAGRGAVVALALALAWPAQASPASWDDAEKQIAACFAAMDRDPALALVNAKFARRNPTAAQLADRTLATDDEADALRLRVRKTRPCREMRLAAVRAFHPLLEPAYTALYYQADQVFAYLIDRLLTYGSANRFAAESLALFQQRSRAYFAADEGARRSLSETWSEQLQRAHSNPPPPEGDNACGWVELNLECR
jgi:hypothetical protein